ncbi:hypothetical protein ARALYDRAFT_915357 [Arabidopsis lyrata subsp. lyrata]|uniref:RING-type domain-containing protein n=1 Tax=Arabidopsis lyrata subsp. lyrata TaxID=81972 RepID=D7MBC0_ARALL|nr:hypothetical protein ARALYDRAFT_915357 [Arabidopsis lyrata subsp. lyrata]
MNMRSSDRATSDNQMSSLCSWKFKRIKENATDSDSDSANDNKEEVRKLPRSHKFHFNCVDQWLHIISCCPLCKQDLLRR